MKLLVLATLTVSVALAAPQQNSQDVQILRYDNGNFDPNAYKFGFDLSDGSKREEEGRLNNVGTADEALRVTGSYSWVGPDGVENHVNYVADENGYHPQIQRGPPTTEPPRVYGGGGGGGGGSGGRFPSVLFETLIG